MTNVSNRLTSFRDSPTIAMGALVRRLRSEGKDIIPLVNGEPDFVPPENVKQAGITAITANELQYTDVEGTLALRNAISDKMASSNYDCPASQIVVSSGTKPLLHAALLALTDPGDEVILPAPYWPSHLDIISIVGATPVVVNTELENGFRLSAGSLRAAITERTKVVLLNVPCNPSGTVYSRKELQEIISVLKEHDGITVLTDEIYEQISYGNTHVIPVAAIDATFANRVVTINGFSKGYAMMGWRIGFAAGPEPIMKAISKTVGQIVGCPSSISQAAALEALVGDQSYLSEFRRVFEHRRDIALEAISKIPLLQATRPDGAFYLFIDCSGAIGKTLPDGRVIESDEDFILGAIEFGGIAMVHGAVFGLSPYFRISYALDTSLLEEAMRRLAKFCAALG